MFNMPSQHGGIPSGVPRMAFMLLQALLVETDWRFTLRSPWTRDQLPEALQKSRLEVVTIDRPKVLILNVLREAVTMPSFCRRQSVDLLVNVDPFGSPRGAPRRLTIVHDIYFRAVPAQFSRRELLTNDIILRMILSGSDRIACVSHATAKDIAQWYPKSVDKIDVIHSSATLEASTIGRSSNSEARAPYLLVVGNATPNKNLAIVAEAFAQIADEFPRLNIVHVGKDNAETIANGLGPDFAVRLERLSGLTDAELGELYAGATCLCVPSLYEGFCLPILEAQDFGCPVLSSNVSAMPEIAGEGAVYFSPDSADELAKSLRKILNDASLREQLIKAGHLNRKRFSWQIAAAQYARLFESVMRSSSHATSSSDDIM